MIIVVDSEAKFIKEIGSKNHIVSTILFKNVCQMRFNRDNAIELRELNLANDLLSWEWKYFKHIGNFVATWINVSMSW